MSYLEFLDRCSRPNCEPVRIHFQSLFDSISPVDQAEYLPRIRSKLDSDLYSSIFELHVGSVLRNAGLSPSLFPKQSNGGAASRPDWRIAIQDQALNVECVLAMPPVEEMQGNIAWSQFYVGTMKHLRDKTIRVRVRRRGDASPPSAKKFAAWLDGIPSDAPLPQIFGDSARPEAIEVYIRHSERVSDSVLFIENSGFEHVDSVKDFGKRFKEKRRQHREHPEPLLIVLGWPDFANEPDLDDIKEIRRDVNAKTGSSVLYVGSWHPSMTEMNKPQLFECIDHATTSWISKLRMLTT